MLDYRRNPLHWARMSLVVRAQVCSTACLAASPVRGVLTSAASPFTPRRPVTVCVTQMWALVVCYFVALGTVLAVMRSDNLIAGLVRDSDGYLVVLGKEIRFWRGMQIMRLMFSLVGWLLSAIVRDPTHHPARLASQRVPPSARHAHPPPLLPPSPPPSPPPCTDSSPQRRACRSVRVRGARPLAAVVVGDGRFAVCLEGGGQ